MTLISEDLDAGVSLITFNRPERNNAWTMDMEHAYFDILLHASGNPDVRVIVVTGAGKSFCPGMDLADVAESSQDGRRSAADPRRPVNLALLIPKPIIAVVNGGCAGVGFVLACSADIRFAASTAKLATSFSRRGLPAEHGLAWLLPRLIGTGAAMDLLISGRTVLAEEAHAMGLVNKVYAPDVVLDEALNYARDLAANCSPRSMAVIKQQVLTDWDLRADESRQRSLELVDDLRDEVSEGSRSWIEKRPPRFPGVSATLTEERGYRRRLL